MTARVDVGYKSNSTSQVCGVKEIEVVWFYQYLTTHLDTMSVHDAWFLRWIANPAGMSFGGRAKR